jgi:hypothetical protein
MSPTRKPIEQRTRYDLAHDHLKHHFENGTLPFAPPRDEQPADIVAVREGGGSGKECAVCPWPINDPLPLPGQRASVEYEYASGRVLSFHGDCHAAWVDQSRHQRERRP